MAVSFLLKISDIPGESNDAEYKDWIEIDNWSFGENQSGTSAFGSGHAGGRVTMQDFRFTKHLDKSSAKIFERCATGGHIEGAKLLARRSGVKDEKLLPYLEAEFKDLIISSYQTSGTGNDSGLPMESISFNFGWFKMTHYEQKGGQQAGQIAAGYDAKQNQSF